MMKNIKYWIYVSISLILIFLLIIFFDQKSALNNTLVTIEMEVPPTIINYPQSRGAIKIDNQLYINSNSKVISSPSGFDKWTTKGPLFRTEKYSYIYKLSDVRIPYELSKKRNIDTIVVKKDNYILKFKLEE